MGLYGLKGAGKCILYVYMYMYYNQLAHPMELWTTSATTSELYSLVRCYLKCANCIQVVAGRPGSDPCVLPMLGCALTSLAAIRFNAQATTTAAPPCRRRHPNLILLDTSVIAAAPKRLLVRAARLFCNLGNGSVCSLHVLLAGCRCRMLAIRFAPYCLRPARMLCWLCASSLCRWRALVMRWPRISRWELQLGAAGGIVHAAAWLTPACTMLVVARYMGTSLITPPRY